jgi:hypothetical protein
LSARAALLALGLFAAACDAAAPIEPDAGVPDLGVPDLVAASDAAGGCALEAQGTLLAFVDAVVAQMALDGGKGSGALVVPSAADRDSFAALVTRALAGDEAAACALPPSYRLLHLADPSLPLRVVAEVDATGAPSPSLFWGTYAAPRTAPLPSRHLVVEAPHPIFDTNTEHQASAVFMAAQADALLIAGAHRCADAAQSGCDGTTDACDATVQPYRISDAAHATVLPFYAVHAALSAIAALSFLQLHGNAEPCPDALVSDGSGAWSAAGAAGRLASELEARGVGVGRCGLGYPTATCTLCGTDNVEARQTAGAADACTQTGSGYGRLVHVEQQLGLRRTPMMESSGYQPLVDAVLAAFPTS